MDQQAWTAAHVEAFAFFGGVPARLVPDNLTTGVDKPDLYDPKINRSYAELAEHYGVLIDPARARKPRTRPGSSGRCRMCGTRSGAAGSSPRWPQMQAAAVRLVPRGGRAAGVPAAGRRGPGRGVRRGRGRGAATVAGRGRSCWPPGRRATVGPDIHAKVGKTLYSVPWRLIGATRRRPRDLDHGAALPQRTAGRDPRPQGHAASSTDLCALPAGEDRVPRCAPRPGAARRAAEIGPALRRGDRRAAGGRTPCSGCAPPRACSAWPTSTAPHRLEAACAKAIAAGDPSYRTIKGILAAGTETDPPPAGDR